MSHPLRIALDSVANAFERRGKRFDALQALGDAVRSIISISDRGLRIQDFETAFGRSQQQNIAAIRRLSLNAAKCTPGEYATLLVRARTETVRACRSQVRKIRIERAKASDAPGGEG